MMKTVVKKKVNGCDGWYISEWIVLIWRDGTNEMGSMQSMTKEKKKEKKRNKKKKKKKKDDEESVVSSS